MGGWITFLPGYYELLCRKNLFIVFKLCCLGLSNTCEHPPVLSLALPSVASSVSEFESCVRGVQSSLSGLLSNASGLISNTSSAAPVSHKTGPFRESLLEDGNFSVWNVTVIEICE